MLHMVDTDGGFQPSRNVQQLFTCVEDPIQRPHGRGRKEGKAGSGRTIKATLRQFKSFSGAVLFASLMTVTVETGLRTTAT